MSARGGAARTLLGALTRRHDAAGLATARWAHREVSDGVLPPWWKLTHTPQQGVILAMLHGALALLAWVLQALRPDGYVLSVAVTATLATVAFALQARGLRRLLQTPRRARSER